MNDSITVKPAIVRVEPEDASLLREIAIQSKDYWGYPTEWMAQFAQTLLITEESIAQDIVYKACVQGAAVGWYRLLPGNSVAILDDLWVVPAWIGRGMGGALFRHAEAQARLLGAQAIELDADPNAAPFYEHMGFRVIGQSLTDWGRYVPRMLYNLYHERDDEKP